MDTISILIVDDTPLFRDGIHMTVAEASAEFLVVGEATDGAHALDLALTHEPAVVLLNATRGAERLRGHPHAQAAGSECCGDRRGGP